MLSTGEKKINTCVLLISFSLCAIQNLCQELETKFYEGTFNWESVKQHDAASLLKLFLRELPQPLLSVEYLKAFQAVQSKLFPCRSSLGLGTIHTYCLSDHWHHRAHHQMSLVRHVSWLSRVAQRPHTIFLS